MGRDLPAHVDMETLDEYNFKSDAWRIGRDWYDNGLDSKRQLNSFVAHYANLVVQNYILFDGKVTTTQHNEAVIITVPDQRNPVHRESLVLEMKEDSMYFPDSKREFVNEFRDTVAGMVMRIVSRCHEMAMEMRTPTAPAP